MSTLRSIIAASIASLIAVIVVLSIGIGLSYLYGVEIVTKSEGDWFGARLFLGLIHVGLLYGIWCLQSFFGHVYKQAKEFEQ